MLPSGRVPRLLAAYAVVGVAILAAQFTLRYLTGYFHRRGQVWMGGQLMVDHGKVYHSMYTGELVWHALAALLIVTVWYLKSDKVPEGTRGFAWFLLSPRVNVIAGIVFIFGALGLLAGKAAPDPVRDAIVSLDLVLVAAVLMRVACRGIYRWRSR